MAKQPRKGLSSPAAVPAKYAAYLADGKLTAEQKAEAERLKLAPPVLQRPTPGSTPITLSGLPSLLMVARPISVGSLQPASTPDNWPAWGLAFRNVAKTHVNRWLGAAEIVTGSIQGCNAFSSAGSFRSSYPLAPMMDQELSSSGVPSVLSRPLADAFARAWADWSDSLFLPGLPFYPMFQAWPAPATAVMSNLPMPLSAFPAPGIASLTPVPLAQRLQAALPTGYSAQTAAQPLRDFATWFSGRFSAWQSGVVVQNVLGWGSTAFAPPYVPVSPVVNGTLRAPPGFITQMLT
jgi:hypothetical protein